MSSGKHDIKKKGRPKKLRSQVALPGPWRNSSWVNSFGGKGASPLKYQEVSPGFVLRQLLVLIEKGKFIDASQLVNKITMDALKDVVKDIPIESTIECIPQSLILLESLYSRLFISDADNFPVEQFQVEVMVFHIVRYLSMLQSSMEYKYPKPEDAKKSIMNILRIVLHVNPDLVRTLYKRKKLMDTALQGIGEHGLIEMNGSLVSLHDALKREIGRNITAYRGAVNTLEHLSFSRTKPISLALNGDKKSSHGHNHQALTKLNESQVKSRLFKNKALLNAIESSINSQLPALVATLKNRIEYDKSALLAFGKLKSEIKTFSSHTKVVPLLAQYSSSLHSVLNMFKELLDEHCVSDKSSYSTLGYHSDEEDMLSVQEAADDNVSPKPVEQPETEENTPKETPPADPIEQILNPLLGEQTSLDKLSLPGEEAPEKRSRWWNHHKRSRSVDVGGNRGGQRRRLSAGSESGVLRSRSRSADRIAISKPRRESVEESQEFQTMMTRIRDMSASSPAIGRRQLERRGISQPRSRDSSISPAALRKHFFGGGSQSPSMSSQTDLKDDLDPLYATIKPKSQRTKSSDKEASKDDKDLSQRLEDALKERDHLAEREKKLAKENDRLKDLLRLVTMEMEKMKEGRSESANDEVFLLSPDSVENGPRVAAELALVANPVEGFVVSSGAGSSVSDGVSPVLSEAIPVPEQFATPDPVASAESPDSPSEQVYILSTDQPNRSPPQSRKTASFVEQQKAVLREQAERLSQSFSKIHHQPPEELPESIVKQRKASFERQVQASQQEPSKSPPQVKRLANLDEKPDVPSLAAPQEQVSSDKQEEGRGDLETVKPSQNETIQVGSSSDDEQSPAPSAGTLQPDNEPREPVVKQESLTEPTSSMDYQEPAESPAPIDEPQPTAHKNAKSAVLFNQPHLAPIPETSSPVLHLKSASLVKQARSPDGSNNRPSKKVEQRKSKTTHTNRHLPKNIIRGVMDDLLYDYDKLYSEQRAVAWTGLTIPPEDKDALLFSVIVFAFQSAQTTIHELHMARARMLLIPTTDDEESVSSYTMDIRPDNRSQVELLEHLRKMGDSFDLNPMITDILERLYETSEHAPLLQSSAPLTKFVTSCVSLAWQLSIQSAPYVIDFELRSFDASLHQRAQGCNRKSARVKEHIWPSLLESSKGMCVYKGVVIT
ncbi:uncharacterized protein LOC110983109 [Acanthaster planci]|uniref:Mitochondria-eating protein n=1 Tax=Acanthaster planci TaxID=133434 RepID=A0A8B7YZ30_ACAPL|nr:uncharacterized protein LOC110983109 [Acanthaster planci]